MKGVGGPTRNRVQCHCGFCHTRVKAIDKAELVQRLYKHLRNCSSEARAVAEQVWAAGQTELVRELGNEIEQAAGRNPLLSIIKETTP